MSAFLLSVTMQASLTASWQPVPADDAWQRTARTSSPPRSGPTASADQAGNVWLFGGYAEPEGKPRHVVNDLLRYDGGSGWQQLQEPIDVTLKGGRVRDNRPGPRLATASCVVGDEMLVFGGWDPQTPGTGGVILDDVWSLSLAKQTWRRLAAPMPGGPASRHVVCNVGGTVILHTFRCLDSVLVWDAASETLKEQPTSGTPPSSRGLHVAAAADGHTLVVFGSALAEDMVNDAFALDTRVVGALAAESGPVRAPARALRHCRAGAASWFAAAQRRAARGLVPDERVWALTLDDSGGGEWSLLLGEDAPNAPGPRNAATLSPVGSGGLLLHGGWRPFVSTYGDSHVLKVEA
ncbi:hypothetical protein EMIHUDRAFT_206342 [Emiliania huxleyi CCMP1516]|uniref:Galactose oxidase n=2 Tax=Emiliania huxleyi TaxID=2903 RepID=A0A0D3JNU9_EMIH1|nr:hypothetical protein EMIHUDRAFT_206342 [Emiliania huxleyi CCMP1516]EOD25184.1 hypothetical protein EMIHUDRAFT_206342 [Emiliania huxleyi CCMP1516]|eukprot:XP_005777613.1 hypothetical protein EMIHUDRAFT_206342 [Emiliania huxleyi CCMP1516]